ncbi:ATP-binding protein [Bifidobacterium eulemuris]|uniref:ATP-binding protein n=1 Tax=Bifidobacterium eulemuris TaxID=1765219 RepID=A0A261G365_9BIFI|nr:ATP-binding protein [Bifidobacterium eulemuris]OZG65849.1 ATPase AAA [Bifidobacterium eulemuris]QOL31921.1 ATP-binding protein [Bifidobacterium eulemuris]
MTFPANPFKPTAGVMPPVLIGRDMICEDFSEGLDDGPGAPDRLMLISGPRGSGKTVMLIELRTIAEQRHWHVVDETASEGLCDRLITQIAPDPGIFAGATIKPSLMGASLGEVSTAPALRPSTLRDAMNARLKTLGKNKGLLVTIDEIQDADPSDITAIATAAQHMFRENANVAFVFAGLPQVISDLLNANVVTFLRRASLKKLGDVPLDDVRESFASTIRGRNVAIDDAALDEATQATEGYPYMIQLVGYHMWRASRRRQSNTADEITMRDVREGIIQARARLGEGVCAPVIDNLPERAVDYLKAMAEDDDPSSTAQVAERMNETMDYANQYRAKLIEKKIINAPERGKVDFAIPYLREYLRTQLASS